MGLSTLPMDLLLCQEHSQLSNLLGVVKIQTGLSWRTIDACLGDWRPKVALSET